MWQTTKLASGLAGQVVPIRCDVSQAKDVAALHKEVVKRFGRLDVAVNNAGIEGEIAPLHEQTVENFDRIVAVNLKGTFLCIQAQVKEMLRGGGGSIVNLSSIAGHIGFPGAGCYVASKHAVIGLTKNAALEYAKQKIRINAVCPGGIDTKVSFAPFVCRLFLLIFCAQMLDRLADKLGAPDSTTALAPLHPMGRIGTPAECAELICFLGSDKSSFITGASYLIDGGFVAQ